MASECEDSLNILINQCRCCLKSFDESHKQIRIDRNIRSKFLSLTRIELSTSSELYSKHICSLCNNLLDFFHQIKTEFTKKQKILAAEVEESRKVKTKRKLEEVKVKFEPVEVKQEPELVVQTVFVAPIETELEVDEQKPAQFIAGSTDDKSDNNSWNLEPMKSTSIRTPRAKKPNKYKKVNCPEKDCNKFFLGQKKLEDHVKFDHLNIPFQCKICNFKTHTRDLLKSHEFRIHGDFVNNKEKEQCPECGVFVCGLTAHVKQVHTKEHSLRCDLCGFGTFAVYLIRRHILSRHTPKDLKKRVSCPICDKKLIVSSGNVSLKAHMKNVHGSEGKKFQCYCGLLYKSELYLKNHQRIVHEQKGKRHHCPTCDRCLLKVLTNFINVSQFREHMYKHKVDGRKEWACDICGKMYGSETLMLGHQIFHQEPKFPCTHPGCDKKFHRKHIRERHFKVAHEVQLVDCEHCGKKLNIMHIPRHRKEFHSGLERSVCLVPGCSSLYHRRDHMKGHIKRVHQNYMNSLNKEEQDKFWRQIQKLPMV